MSDKLTRKSSGARLPLRAMQIALGVIWVADGVLQLQPYMFGVGFLRDAIGMNAQGQPWIIHWTIAEAVRITLPHHVLWNALFALIQLAIGVGLIVSRRTVRSALAVSFVWALIVWWFGEGVGMLAMSMASPLTGAPGPVILYAVIGLLVWPASRGRGTSLVGDLGTRAVWALLWFLMAGLMLAPFNSAANATRFTFAAAAEFLGSRGPLAALDNALASLTSGHGLAFSIIAAVVMAVIGLLVLLDWHRNWALAAGALIGVFLFLTAQFLGGITLGTATDPGTGPLLVLFALLLWVRPLPVVRTRSETSAPVPGAVGGASHG